MAGLKGSRILFLAYSAAIVAVLYTRYPLPSLRFDDPFPVNPEAVFWAPIKAGDLAMYRADPSRSGRMKGRGAQLMRPRIFAPNQNQGVHSASKASPIGSGAFLYSATDSGWLRAYRIDRAEMLWDYYAPYSLRGIHATPLIVGNGICFGLYNGVFQCLDRFNGAPLWLRKLGGAIGASAAYANGAIFVSVETTKTLDGYVVKLDPENGKLLWRSNYLGEQAHSSPAILGGRVFVGANNGVIAALDEATGNELWRFNVGGAIKSTPLAINDRVLVTSVSGELLALSAEKGEVLWRTKLSGASQSSPSLLRNGTSVVISAETKLSVHSISDGKLLFQHDWRGEIIQARMPSALALEDSVWIACGNRTLCVFSADGSRLLRRHDLSGTVTGMPWYQNGKIFVSTTDPGDLYIFE